MPGSIGNPLSLLDQSLQGLNWALQNDHMRLEPRYAMWQPLCPCRGGHGQRGDKPDERPNYKHEHKDRAERLRQMHALEDTHSWLQKQHQNEGKHNGENDRACDVERRQTRQNEETTQKERLRVGRQRHILVTIDLRQHSTGFRCTDILDRRRSRALRRGGDRNHGFSLPGRGLVRLSNVNHTPFS